jgi:hypothetical protein
MPDPDSLRSRSPRRVDPKTDPELYAQLRAELKTPYRGLRQFIYVAFGASGLIGSVVFLAQLAAGREIEAALPNLALQVGVVALMVGLFRWEQRRNK